MRNRVPIEFILDKIDNAKGEYIRSEGIRAYPRALAGMSAVDARKYAAISSGEKLSFSPKYAPITAAEFLGLPLEKKLRYRPLSAEELVKSPPLQWLVRGVFPAQGIAAIFGPSGSGKTFLALDLAAALVTGLDWFGHRVRAVPVIYLGLEGKEGLKQRVRAWQVQHGQRLPDSLRFIFDSFDLRNAMQLEQLTEAVLAIGGAGGVVIIDTLNRAASGADENSAHDMGVIITAAQKLQAAIGGLVLLVHHTGKDVTRGLRGHSSLHAALDAAVEVLRLDDGREWRVAKAKDGEDGKAHFFRLEVVELGEDAEGELVTSCVVAPDKKPKTPVGRAKVPSGGNQRIVWDALGELFRAAGAVAPEGAPKELPVGRPCLRLDDATAKVRDRLPVESDRKTERTRQAVTGLINRGLLVYREGFIWCK